MDDTTNKKRLRLSLRKNQKPIQERFSSVMCEEIKEVAKGVVPANTKSSNEWALKNLRAWISDRNTRMSDEAVPADLFACEDADILCKWMCCFVLRLFCYVFRCCFLPTVLYAYCMRDIVRSLSSILHGLYNT